MSVSLPPKARARKIYPREKWIGLETNPIARRIVKDSSAFSGRVADQLAIEIKNHRGQRSSIRLSDNKSQDALLRIENEIQIDAKKPVYAETIMIQDLVLITDIISFPRLIELFGESNFSRRNLEEQLISAIDVVDPDVLAKNCRK